MSTLGYIAAFIAAVFVFFRIKSGFNKYRAAMNALLAKHTFSVLGPSEQLRVVNQAKQILVAGRAGDGSMLDRAPDREKFGFYALAMAELGIQPALPGQEWSLVRNPFVALTNAATQIRTAQMALERDHGAKIDL